MGVRGEPTKWDKWYSTARWARIRRHQLREHPFCAFCLERGIVTPAEICDHVEAHRGDVNKFWLGPFQSLCKRCHDRSGSSRRAVSASILAWMAGLWTRAIQLQRSAPPVVLHAAQTIGAGNARAQIGARQFGLDACRTLHRVVDSDVDRQRREIERESSHPPRAATWCSTSSSSCSAPQRALTPSNSRRSRAPICRTCPPGSRAGYLDINVMPGGGVSDRGLYHGIDVVE